MLGVLFCARYRFVLGVETALRLNSFAGATLRGGFGHVFKRTVCVWRPGDCPRCLLKHTCSYPYVFETAPPPGAVKLRGLEQIPRPFVLEPPDGGRDRPYLPGEQLAFRLVLVGRAIDYLPYFLLTFTELGRAGLGTGRGRFTVAEVYAEGRTGERLIYTAAEGVLRNAGDRLTGADFAADPFPPPEAAGGPFRFAVHFRTPTRIRNDGAIREEVSFQDLIRALLRRISSLCYFHCGRELSVDFKSLIEQASTIRVVASRLRWREQQRFSGRQRQRIDMGGVVGVVEYEGGADVLRSYWPLLRAGEWVHVGKGAVMGMGQISSQWLT